MRVVLPQMRSLAAARGWPLEFQVTQNAEDLEKRAKQAIQNGRRFLVAMGGDGTFQTLLNAGVGTDVVLGVIPTGGGNDFARALGLPADPLLALEEIIYGVPRRVDLALARTSDGRERYYAGGGGLGLDAEAASYAEKKYSHVPGRLRYVVAALHALKGFEPIDLSVEFPEGDQPNFRGKALLASVLNTTTYGAGLRLAPEARTDDGLLDVVLLGNLKLLEILALVPRLLVQGELRTSRIERMKTTRVRLTTDRPCLFHGDGELLGPAPVEVEVIPGAIQVLVPRSSK
ncbi:MAG: diacylglycerol kinase family lipid kinase [Candidatus Acidiferrum sp.]